MYKNILVVLALLLVNSQSILAQAEKRAETGNGNNGKEPGKNAISTGQDFNTTRSNRERSNFIIVNVGGNNPAGNDSTPIRHEAQDFNTTRSNRERSNFIIVNVGDNNAADSDSTPIRHEAQDFNTTRSNRERSNFIIVNVGGNNPAGNDSTPIRHEAQDFNTTRSNRERSNFLIVNVGGNNPAGNNTSMMKNADTTKSRKKEENYNPWEMDDNVEGTVLNPLFEAPPNGSIKEKIIRTGNGVIIIIRSAQPEMQPTTKGDNPLYQGQSSSGVNPMFESAKNSTAGNSTNSQSSGANNGFAIPQGVQNYNHTRNDQCAALSVYGGFSGDAGDHTGTGWQIGTNGTLPLIRNLKLAIGISYNAVKFQYPGSPDLSNEYRSAMGNSIGSNNWRIFTVNAGLLYRIGNNKLNADLYGKIGASFVKVPNQFIGIPGGSGQVDNESGIAKFSGNKTAASVDLGISLNYAISSNVDIFLNPHFFSTLGKSISYQEKDASKALTNNKTFDYRTFTTLPYSKKTEQIQMPGLKAGVRFYFCK